MTNFGYQLRRISGPAVEPLTLDEAKRQCRIDADLTDEDPDVLFWISGAREKAEEHCKRTFGRSTWLLKIHDFPRCWPSRLELPNGPMIALLRVSYLDTSGNRVDLDLDSLGVGLDDMPPYIEPGTSGWPQVMHRPDSVQIEYDAGYAGAGSPEDASEIPFRVKQACRMMVAHWHANREAVVAETRTVPTIVPLGWEDCLQSLVVFP